MKKLVFILSVISSVAFLNSCNNEYLVTEPTETLSTPSIEQKVNGMYQLMIQNFTGGTTNHEDFGQKGVDVYLDIMQSDVAYQRDVYGRYRTVANYSAFLNYENNNNYIPWRYYYKMVYSANDIINDYEKLGGAPEFLGQALAMRGYAYFYLMQLYTKEFAAAGKGVPIITSILQEKSEMKTQQEVYDFIIEDLTKAETLLDGYVRNNKIKADKNVVRGLLAYTYAAMNNPAKSLEYANKVIGAYPITSAAQLTGGFNNLATSPSWVWGANLEEDMGLDLVSWWGQMDIYTYSYQSVGDYKTIDDLLRLSIKDDDVRQKQFVKFTSGGVDYWMGANKFYHPAKQIQGQRNISTDYVFMRSDEFHLLKAEAQAKQNDLAGAKATLKALLANRMTDFSALDAAATKDDLIKEIHHQTRVELWGEGKAYLSTKRNKLNVVRGQNHQYLKGLVMASTDDRFTFAIPQAEVINNPNL